MKSSEIKQMRWSLNLSQRELAKKLDVSQSVVAQWEKQIKKPGRKNLNKLEELLQEIVLSPEDAWNQRKPYFKLSADDDAFALEMSQLVSKLIPEIHIQIPERIHIVIVDEVNRCLVRNPKYFEFHVHFRTRLDLLNLELNLDYELSSVDHDVFIKPLNKKTWNILKPENQEDDDLIRNWLNRS